MGLELAEQLGWEVPDVIFYPTGGGTGLIGMWKAFAELEEMGWIGKKRPRMVAVQAAGCAPMVKAWEDGRGARAALAGRAYLCRRHPRAAGGRRLPDPARGARERRVRDCGRRRGDRRGRGKRSRREEGFLLCPEGAATYAAYKQALADGRVGAGERAVLFNCASGLKYPMPKAGTRLKLGERIDWQKIIGGASRSQGI